MQLLERPDFKTDPVNSLDGFLWRFVDFFSYRLSDGKISHPWHWQRQKWDRRIRYQNFNSKENVKNLENDKWIPGLGYVSLTALRRSLGGWQSVLVLTPKNLNNGEHWHYVVPDILEPTEKILRCSIQLPGSVRVLLGSGKFRFMGITDEGKQVQLKVQGPFARKTARLDLPLI